MVNVVLNFFHEINRSWESVADVVSVLRDTEMLIIP